jgi:DNA-binding NarL/FixJ family response regulator
MALRLLLVDDHEVVRIGLHTLLERYPQFVVVDEAGTADEAVEKALRQKPDVVIMDIRLPGRSGIDACREITTKLPSCKVLMLTSYAEDELLLDAIAAGASGYVLKQVGSTDLIHALEAVSRGESLLDPRMTQRVFERLRVAQQYEQGSAFSSLNPQERRILALIAEGKTNREIAHIVHLSEKTVRNYVSDILSKLGLSSRAQAAAYAVEHRLKGHLL